MSSFNMRRAALAAVLFFAVAAQAAIQFPTLSGRVVDDAQVLSVNARATLENNLAQFEQQSGGDQLVVVTLSSLQGQTIEDYGYQLGRHWGIGQKGKDNGVLLIVAPKEHKVRIEVGYGLEGTLTDAASHEIIQDYILPAFKQGQMQKGILAGVQQIEQVATGHPTAMASLASHLPQQSSSGGGGSVILFILFGLFFFSQILLFFVHILLSVAASILSLFGFNALKNWLAQAKNHILPRDRAFLYWLLMPSPRFTGSGGGSFSGGFSGGGGGFGGGGSSGSW